MDEDRAALFCGAGTSISSGMDDWRSLLQGIADNLGLNVEFVSDLVELAQFNFNERGTRDEIHELIVNEYGRRARHSALHDHLIRLPVNTVWTTNYDQLLEHAYERNGMRADVKISAGSLGAHPRLWDVQIFKMHGDINDADNAVLTKFDYDEYPYSARGRGFLTALEVAIISQTFLFLGFSFSDPNLDRILGRVSVLRDRVQRVHYCIMKRPDRPARGSARSKAEHDYRLTELRIKDLHTRFKIETVLVDSYDEITNLVRQLSRASRRNHVFVSAAAHDYSPLGQERLLPIARQLGSRLAREQKFLISGFGLGVGQDVVDAFFDEAYQHEAKDLTDRAVLRPFPQRLFGDEKNRGDRWTRYRRDMIGRAGFVVFIAGNKLEGGSVVPSTGMREEFEIAQAFGVVPIPLGSTGSVAHEIWSQVISDPTRFYGSAHVSEEIAALGADGSDGAILDAVFSIMQKVIDAPPV